MATPTFKILYRLTIFGSVNPGCEYTEFELKRILSNLNKVELCNMQLTATRSEGILPQAAKIKL